MALKNFFWVTLPFMFLFFFFLPSALADTISLTEGIEYHWGDRNWQPLANLKEIPGDESFIALIFSGRNNKPFLMLKITLPPMKEKNPSLFVSGVYGSFGVIQNQELLYEYIAESSSDAKLYYPYQYHIFPLTPHNPAEPLYFRISSQHLKIGIHGDILVGTEEDFQKRILKRDLDRIIATVIAFLFCLFSFFLFKKNKSKEWLAFSFFVLCCILANINFTYSKQLIYNNPDFWPILQNVFTYLGGFCFFVFAEKITLGHILMRKIWQMHIFLGGCALFFFWLNNSYLILIALAVLWIIGMSGLTMILFQLAKKGNYEARLFCVGLGVFSVGVIFDMFTQIGLIPWMRSIGHWGLLVLFLFLTWILQRRKKASQANPDKEENF